MGLLIEPVDISKYEFVRIPIKEEFGLFVRKDSPLTNKEYIIPEDLLNLLIISPKRNLVQNEISSWFGDYAEEINIISTYNLRIYRTYKKMLKKHIRLLKISIRHKVNNQLLYRCSQKEYLFLIVTKNLSNIF